MITTVLTGRRPDLLDRCLQSLPFLVTVFVNDITNDQRSVEVARKHKATVVGWDGWTSVGDSMNRIASEVSGDYWLHIEDDWELRDPFNLDELIGFLDTHPDIGQIRLRRRDDGAQPNHYLTRRPINWQGEGILIGTAHATWNPTLQRASVAGVYPVTDEVDFMRKMPSLNAQTDPGHFTHLGAGRSLR